MESKLNRVRCRSTSAETVSTRPTARNTSQASTHSPNTLSVIYPNTRRVATSTKEEIEQYGIPELSKDMEDLSLPQQSFFKHYHGTSHLFRKAQYLTAARRPFFWFQLLYDGESAEQGPRCRVPNRQAGLKCSSVETQTRTLLGRSRGMHPP